MTWLWVGAAWAQHTVYGVVAEDDIYTGTRLAGATVEIVETGATTTTSSSGVYTFSGVSDGSYTFRATMSGYDPGTCAKTLDSTASEWWCSIALTASEADTDTDTDTDSDTDTDTDTDSDTDADTYADTADTGFALGVRGQREKMSWGGCATAPEGGALAALLALLIARRRR